MKMKIHYIIGEYEDNYVLNGLNIEDIKNANEKEMDKRGLNVIKNSMWSETIESE